MGELNASATPYDDVFRTLVNDCGKLVFPVINEMFGEHYTGQEEIAFSPNEHFLNRQDGAEEKRVTDTCFVILGEMRKRYHLECQSTADNSILIRIFEYDAQIALDQEGRVEGNRITVSFPNTGVLYLRSTSKTPDTLEVVIRTPGGDVAYGVPVMRINVYTIDEIFDKGLLFLIPFYIFTYESRFPEIEGDEEKLAGLRKEYEEIRDRLEALAQSGVIDEFYKKTIMDMSERVIANIARRYENIRKGVGSVMTGSILEYEAKRIRNEGWKEGQKEGWEKGQKEGREEGIFETLNALVKKGLLSIADAASQAGVSESAFCQKLTQ